MTDTIRRAALFLGASDQRHHVALIKRARALGAEVVSCYQCLPEDLGLAGDNLTVGAANGKFDLVVIPSCASIDHDPIDALGIVARLLELGVQIESLAPEESWLPNSPDVIAPLARWLQAQASIRKAETMKRALQKAREAGRQIGRPRKTIDLARALELIATMPISRAAHALGCGATSLRRCLKEHEAQQMGARRVAA